MEGQKSVYIKSISFILIHCKKKGYYKNLRVNQVPVHRKLNDKGHIRMQWSLECPGGLVGFPDSSVGKEFACNAGDPGMIPGLGRSTGEGIGYPLQCSWASFLAQLVKNLPAMWEIWVDGLMVRISGFHFYGPGSIPGQGSYVVWQKNQKSRKKGEYGDFLSSHISRNSASSLREDWGNLRLDT